MSNLISKPPQDYVLGFMFDQDGDTVALIRKDKPDWQKGKLNGIGGKVESGESAAGAMRREFKEEAGVDFDDWRQVLDYGGVGWTIYIFAAFSGDIYETKTMEEEIVSRWKIWELSDGGYGECMPNLSWIIPMVLYAYRSGCSLSVQQNT